jgi:hypothetical protein
MSEELCATSGDQATSRARKHWLGWGAAFVIAVAIGIVGGSPFDWAIVVVVMAFYSYGLAALLRKSLGFGLLLAVVAIVLGTFGTIVLPDDLRYAGTAVVWLVVLAGSVGC